MGLETVLFLSAASDGRIFGLDQQTLIGIVIQLLNSSVLAVVLSLVLYKPVREFMRKRTDKIRGQMRDAEEEMAKASELKVQYEQMLGDIERDKNRILETAHKLAVEKGQLLVEEANREAEAVKRRAALDIQKERESVEEELRLYIIEVSAAMAGKIAAKTIDRATQDRLFDETMAELEEMAWRN